MSKRIIMVVDDSNASRRMISAVLMQGGYEVVEAVDGEDAFSKLADTKVDMIITDLIMPKLDGIGLIKEVRKSASHRFIPIVTLSADVQSKKRDEAKAAGATAWLAKPVIKEDILSVAAKVLG